MASLRKHGKVWYYRFTDANGVKREVKGCTDKRVTEELARAAESEAAKIRAGICDPFKTHRNRPIGEHIDDYIGFIRSEGGTDKHVSTTEARIRAIVDGIGARRLDDLDAVKVSDWLARQRKRKDGMSAQTSNHYLQRIRSFANWLVRATGGVAPPARPVRHAPPVPGRPHCRLRRLARVVGGPLFRDVASRPGTGGNRLPG
jgi:hypothetical protein